MNMVVIIYLSSADTHVAGVHAANVYMCMETTTMTVANIQDQTVEKPPPTQTLFCHITRTLRVPWGGDKPTQVRPDN